MQLDEDEVRDDVDLFMSESSVVDNGIHLANVVFVNEKLVDYDESIGSDESS